MRIAWQDTTISRSPRASAVDLDTMLAVNYSLLGRSYKTAGRSAEALAVARRVLTLTNEPRVLGIAANTLAIFGEGAESRAILAKLEALPANTPRRNTGLAFAYLGRGGLRNNAR
jgi:hypothetical protein